VFVYLLTRDDGAECRLDGGAWEAALELAYLYGWRPAGTAIPTTEAWRGRGTSAAAGWDSQDYFSHQSQHVERGDARALGKALLQALHHVPVVQAVPRDRPVAAGRGHPRADGVTLVRSNALRRLALFSDIGGFTIGRSP